MSPLLLTPNELAIRWNITTKTLSQWRYYGRGPRFSKVSRLINYRLPDVEEFENSKLCRSTSEYFSMSQIPSDHQNINQMQKRRNLPTFTKKRG